MLNAFFNLPVQFFIVNNKIKILLEQKNFFISEIDIFLEKIVIWSIFCTVISSYNEIIFLTILNTEI